MSRKLKISSSDDEFVEELKELGVQGIANKYAVSPGTVVHRRNKLEAQLGRQLPARTLPRGPKINRFELPYRLEHRIDNGTVLIGSDAHLWPGHEAPAWDFFVQFVDTLQPEMVILNGDVLDFPRIGRHDPIGWEEQPEVADELSNAQDKLHDLEHAARRARLVWPAGNHDLRFETKLARELPEYRAVGGLHLKDHFPNWEPCWSLWLNDIIAIKHRWKGGDHAGHNNTIRSGVTFVTGHDHQLKVTPYSDYTGIRWGIQTGTLADPLFGQQFVHYTEDNPRNWTAGFVVLTFVDGELLWPELAHVTSRTTATFRGEIHAL